MAIDRLTWMITGWKYGDKRKEKEIEKLEERYIRWMLGVERTTIGYMVREKV